MTDQYDKKIAASAGASGRELPHPASSDGGLSGTQPAPPAGPLSMRLALIRSGFGLRADPGIRAQVRRFIREERAVRVPQTFDDLVRSIPEQTEGGFARG